MGIKTADKAILEFEQLRDRIKSATFFIENEDKKEKDKRISKMLTYYSHFVDYYFPHYTNKKQKTTAPFQLKEANELKKNTSARKVVIWSRGFAKSTTFCLFIPLWLMQQKQDSIKTVVIVGKSENNAQRLLNDIKYELEHNRRYINDFGMQYNLGSWDSSEFTTRSGVHFMSLGRGQSPRGIKKRENRPDYIVVDDIDDDELCLNETRVNKLHDWVLEALMGTMQMGRGRFIVVGNKISKNSIIQKMEDNEGFSATTVNALDDKGRPSWNIYSKKEIDRQIQIMGYRASQKEYFNNPIITGSIFSIDWIKYKKALPFTYYDDLICYCDPSFKEGRTADYKAIVLVGQADTNIHILDAFVRKCSIYAMVNYFYDLDKRIKANNVICRYYIEASFIQDMLLDDFKRQGLRKGYQLSIRGDNRVKPNKFQRIEAISPLFERGFVFINEDKKGDKDMKRLIEQLLAFGKGSSAHDDAPDALEGAISLLRNKVKSHGLISKFGKNERYRFY